MEAEGRAILRGASVAEDAVRIRRTAEMHYTGQGHDVEVELPAGMLAAASLGPITERFEDAYRALYSRVPLSVPIEALNFRVVVSGPLPDISVSGAKPAPASTTVTAPVPKGTRKAYFPEVGGYVDTPVYDRYTLTPGAAFVGPAIIEERESTTVAGPGARGARGRPPHPDPRAGGGLVMDPITLDICWNRLIGVVNEQAAAPHAHVRSRPSCARRATCRRESSTAGAGWSPRR
jgi:N-methylhydantoinase A/oxoprolinase/acetone carboxylase beta subunit